MEDALVQNVTVLKNIATKGLNPCCNGRCTRTGEGELVDLFKAQLS